MGTFSPPMVLWGLILFSAFGAGLAFACAAELCEREGISPLAALCIPANPGLISALCILSADPLALGSAMLGLVCWRKGHSKFALFLFAAAALCKEAYLLVPLSVALYEMFCLGDQKAAWRSIFLPALPLSIWVLWLMFYAKLPDAVGAWGDLDLPFRGIYHFLGNKLQPVLEGHTQGYIMLGVLLLSVWLALKPREPLIAYLAWPWIMLGVLLSDWIWRPSSDAARASLSMGACGLECRPDFSWWCLKGIENKWC